MAQKKSWYETINDRLLAPSELSFSFPSDTNFMELSKSLFNKALGLDEIDRRNRDTVLKNVDLHISPVEDLMEELEGFGFKDKGNHYEMVTNLGGSKGDAGSPENAVKVELTGKDNRVVEITYEHSTSEDENCFYSHSQKTSVTLPNDADENTLRAFYDDDDNVVVSVKKRAYAEGSKNTRSIPVGRR